MNAVAFEFVYVSKGMNGGIDDTVRGCIVWVLIANTQLLHSCCYMMQQEKKIWRGNRL